jgi:uncharacterized membrane protein
LEVSAAVTPLYRAHEGNFSLWTIGYRLFEGTGSPGLSGIVAPPLISIPGLAAPFSLALLVVVLIVSMLLAVYHQSFDAGYSLVVCCSLLVSPIFWVVYLILLLIPMAFVVKNIIRFDFPQWETWIACFLVVFLLMPREILVGLLWRMPHEIIDGSSTVFSFTASLISLLPTLVVLILMGLIIHCDHGPTRQQ